MLHVAAYAAAHLARPLSGRRLLLRHQHRGLFQLLHPLKPDHPLAEIVQVRKQNLLVCRRVISRPATRHPQTGPIAQGRNVVHLIGSDANHAPGQHFIGKVDQIRVKRQRISQPLETVHRHNRLQGLPARGAARTLESTDDAEARPPPTAGTAACDHITPAHPRPCYHVPVMPRYTTYQHAAFTAMVNLFGRPLSAVAVSDLVPSPDLAALNTALQAAATRPPRNADEHKRALYQAWMLSPFNPASPAAASLASNRRLINRMRRRGRAPS